MNIVVVSIPIIGSIIVVYHGKTYGCDLILLVNMYELN